MFVNCHVCLHLPVNQIRLSALAMQNVAMGIRTRRKRVDLRNPHLDTLQIVDTGYLNYLYK
jgi:hypothetical protein